MEPICFLGPLKALLLPYYEEVQRLNDLDETFHHIAGNIRRDVDELALSAGLQGIEFSGSDGSSGDVGHAFESALATTLQSFLKCVFAADGSPGKMDAMENLLEITAALATDLSLSVSEKILLCAIEFSTVLLERVRSLACRFLGTLTKYLMRNPARNHELLDKASQALLPRFTDKSQAVRQAAIEAGSFFFSDGTTDPDILQALIYSVQHDPSVSSRVAALQSLPINLETIDVVLSRVRDVKAKVRTAALKVLEETNVFPMLEAEHCAALVETGLTERCTATKQATLSMIRVGWMKAVDFNPIQLLEKMDVVQYDSQCELMLQAIISATAQDLEALTMREIEAYCSGLEHSLIAITGVEEEIAVESIFFARAVCSQTNSLETVYKFTPSMAADVLPDVTVVCELLDKKAKELMQAIEEQNEDKEAVLTTFCQQLLLLTTSADLEEGSRRHLVMVMKRMLSSIVTPDDLVEDAMKVLNAINHLDSVFVDHAIEVIDELHRLNTLVGDELQENHSIRVLAVLSSTLEMSCQGLSTHPRMSDVSRIVVDAVSHENELVREAAVSCVGKLGFLVARSDLKNTFEPLLMRICHDDSQPLTVRGQAILALSDWSIIQQDGTHRIDCGSISTSLQGLISTMLESDESFLVCVAAEVAIKHLYSGLASDETWLAHLVRIFFDPSLNSAEDEETESTENYKQVGSPLRLQQLLSVFFPAFCVMSEGRRDALLRSVGPLIDIECQRPRQPRKTRVSKSNFLEKSIKFICDSVRRGDELAENGEEALESDAKNKEVIANGGEANQASIELTVAVQIADFLVQKHSSLETSFRRSLFKILGGIDLSYGIHEEPVADVVQLRDLVESLIMAVEEEPFIRALESMSQLLESIDDQSDEGSVHNALSGPTELVQTMNELTLKESKNDVDKENSQINQPTTELAG